MKKLPIIIAMGAVSLLPFQALAADAPATPAAPAANTPAATPPMAGEAWKKLDTNGDGVISKDEWMAAGAKRFDEIDTNHDGKITKEEMEAYRDKMRAHFQEMMKERQQMMGGAGGGPGMMTPAPSTAPSTGKK